MRIKCKDTNEVAYLYSEYLTTRHWQNLRQKVFEKSGGKCACCSRPLFNDFIAHHRTYWRIGHERINHKFWRDDVIAVCPHCHNGDGKEHVKLHQDVRVPAWARKMH